MENTNKKKYGWHPSKPSINRKKFCGLLMREQELPVEIDLSDQFSPCYDQGQLITCTANGIAGIIEHKIITGKYPWQFRPSRLFIYYNERVIEGTVNSESGAAISDGITSVQTQGVCPEIEDNGTNPDWLWTYDDGPSKFLQKPPTQCYLDAVLHDALKTQTISLDRATVLNLLAQQEPIVFGFTVHQSFESEQMANTGIMTVPAAFDPLDPEVGGHCVVACGYKLNTVMGSQGIIDWVLVRNSWGTGWGATAKGGRGYFWMPLDQIMCNADVASDAHIIELVGAKV